MDRFLSVLDRHRYSKKMNRQSDLLALLRPSTQGSPYDYELAQMVGIVVSNEQCLAQHRLPLSMWQRCEQIGCGVRHQLLHGFEVGSERFDTAIPSVSVGRCVAFR